MVDSSVVSAVVVTSDGFVPEKRLQEVKENKIPAAIAAAIKRLFIILTSFLSLYNR